MTVPRENNLVRFYVKPQGVLNLRETRATSKSTIEYLVDLANMIMKPYDLRSKHRHWWSPIQYELPQRIIDLPLTLEHVKQRLVKQYRPHSRYFACPW